MWKLQAPTLQKSLACFPAKEPLALVADADLVIFDPNKKHTISASSTHHMNVDYSAYEGWELTGKVKTVLLRGQLPLIITSAGL
jgi:dihydropyrimidinase